MKALYAPVLYTGLPGGIEKNKYIVFDEESGRIKEVVSEKPRDVEVIDLGKDIVVTPAFIDPHSHIGMVRHGEPASEEESNERFDSVLPLVDAIYSVYMDDQYFRESVEHGVLYSCVLPGSGNIIGGRGALIRNWARNIEEAYIGSCGLKMALGYNPRSTTTWRGVRPYTRMGAIALLQKWIIKARDTLMLIEKGKKDLEEVEPEVQALIPVVKGEEKLRVHVHKADDIVALFMLRYRLGFLKPPFFTIEHACDVHEEWVFERIKREGVPLVYGPIDSWAYKTELRHESYKNMRLLVKVKPFFALMSDHPVVLQRNLFLQTRFLLRYGMDKTEALATVTYNAAKILGLDAGAVKPGWRASLVAWKGDPFSMESYPVMVIGEGKILHEEL
ncbi:amidohydrolase family protein [Pyrolobus fumarii]|uniref:amidohydrolase family protein n=1 Tax=Pyrolobus fumarii TaxID=54252 RepID=UPI00064F4E1F